MTVICFKCFGRDGHNAFCPLDSDDAVVRDFRAGNADLFAEAPGLDPDGLTHPIDGEPKRIPIKSQYEKDRDRFISVAAMMQEWGIEI